jgi:ribonucleoside-triphosphate reductase
LYETDTAIDIADDIEKHIKMFYLRNLNIESRMSLNEIVKEMERPFTVEQIQDLIEEYLMRSERPDVARSYIRFRYKREVAREHKDDFMKAFSEKLEAKNVQNQNANVDEHSFGGRTGEAAGILTKQYALDYCISKKAVANHLNNEVYIHDLDNYAVGMHNCLSVPFDHLLANGFNTRQTDVRPAGSVNTAFQLVAVIFQLQSLQ